MSWKTIWKQYFSHSFNVFWKIHISKKNFIKPKRKHFQRIKMNDFVFNEVQLSEYFNFSQDFNIQWTPLNGITLGPTKTDPINRMILLTKSLFPMKSQFSSWWDCLNMPKSDSINRLIPLSVIPLSGVHCILFCSFYSSPVFIFYIISCSKLKNCQCLSNFLKNRIP